MAKKIKDHIVNAELTLDYEKHLKFHVSVNAVIEKLDPAYVTASNKKDLQNIIALSIASIALNDMGLPTIHEILEKHYPEALL